MAKRTPTARKKTASATRSAPAARIDAESVRGELRQLADIRQRFPALATDVAAALLASHDAPSCRDKGANTRAADIFRIGMSWARIVGEHHDDPAVSPARVRWFLDCLTALGQQLSGHGAPVNPAHASARDDATHGADRLLARTERRARAAAGTHASWRASLDAALTPDSARDARISKLTQLADLVHTWLTQTPAPPLVAYDLDASTVAALRQAAEAIDAAIAQTPAAQQPDRDSPATNTAEGRTLYSMRPLWDDFAEAREDGRSGLQLTVSPSLLRGLDLNVRKAHKPQGPTG